MEIVLRAVETGYNNGWNDHYRKLKKEGKILSPESLQKLLEYNELVEDFEAAEAFRTQYKVWENIYRDEEKANCDIIPVNEAFDEWIRTNYKVV